MADLSKLVKLFVGDLFAFPRIIPASMYLDVPEEWREYYTRDKKNYLLDPDVFDAMLPYVEQAQALRDKIEARERTAAELPDRVRSMQLHDAASVALTQAGVRPALLRGAIAQLADEYKLTVEGEGDAASVVADTAFGKRSLADAVAEFMATDTGVTMRGGKLNAPAPHFAAQLSTKH